MFQKIVMAGGTGFLGNVLAQHFRYSCRELVVLTRKPQAPARNIRYVAWDGATTGAWAQELEGADALVNLCGKPVDCRYNAANRAEILRSRIEPTRALGTAVSACNRPPALWINGTSATIYRHAEDRPQTERDGACGSGFSVDVCQAWEAAFFETETPGTRKVALRTSFVLGRREGAFPRFRSLVLGGLGGRQGSGKQMVSWIHEQDFARIVQWLLEHPELKGAINATAPVPVPNRVLMQTIRSACGIPLGLPAPAWLLRIAARLMGTEAELLLKSRWVVPERLQESGFRFYFETLPYAVNDLVGTRL
ncbi:TIGR01777 family oxidoreductase [Flaviaesturariibacter aridisoli]|uniref:TIGR01777 family protein n=1 Tax=Flaviaesturariibacter aridisoli TaxID=2545761 RepID=A0A4R4DZG4_9BACT|nr:TIGR01777 family oxidoreductase [Flaviaesturariibacter aridisoli]TCZ69312.1 TIGR01777 family protein [Flaviaesturariibacter aridisoli]